MKLKAKLVTTCAAFCLILCLTIVGVWSVATASIPMGGNVGFTASDVDATISGSFSGISNPHNPTTLKLDASTTNVESVAGYDTWQNWSLNFADKAQDIVLTITVTNENAKRAINATFTNSSSSNNITVSLAGGNAAGSDSYTSGTKVTIDPGQSVVFKVTLHVTDANDSASATLVFALKLDNVPAAD